MTRGFSQYLDALRFFAAFVVVLSHWAYPRFTEGRHLWIRDLNLGSDAVVLFFVLSGLVIAFSADRKDPTLTRFAFNRLTRLMSVAIPALLICVALDRTGAALFPQAYDGWWYNPLPLWQQALSGLTFTSEWKGQGLRLGTNGPWWSLSYEAAYYLIFALAFYLTGARRIAALALALLAIGPNILLLMPAWLLGVWVWRRIRAGDLPGRVVAYGYAILPVAFYATALAVDLPGLLHPLSVTLAFELTGTSPRFSDEWIWNALIGAGFAFHLLGMARLCTTTPRPRAWIRWAAGGSFSLYLVHYPALQFLSPALAKAETGLLNDASLLLATTLFCVLFAQIFERTLPRQRVWLRKLSGQGPQRPTPASLH